MHTYIHTYTRLSNRGSLDARVTHTHTHTPKLMVLRLRVVTSGVCSFRCGRCSPSCTPCAAGSSVTSSWVGWAISCVVASASGAERARLAWSGASGASGAWRSFCARCEWSRKNLGGLFLQRNLSLLNAHERLINPRAKTCDTSTITHFGDTAAVAELSSAFLVIAVTLVASARPCFLSSELSLVLRSSSVMMRFSVLVESLARICGNRNRSRSRSKL